MAGAAPTVLVTRAMPDPVRDRLVRDYDARLNDSDELLDGEAVIARAQDCDAIITCSTEKFPAEIIARLPERVKAIATFSVGFEHIDLEAARRRGLVVTNTPEVLNDATADIAMLLLLGAARRGSEGDRLVRAGEWKAWTSTFLCGVHVTGKRLGILGMGRIGRAVARRARGFDMEIHYHNRSRLSPDLEQGACFHESPDDLLRVSDFLSIHAPASPETHHFLNSEHIALLPDGAVVVNTARGPLVDDAALIDALRNGKLAAAGLDVYEGEPNLDPGYRTLDNVFLLPHIGSATWETRAAMGFKCLDNLDAFFAGTEPPDRIA